MVYLETKSVPSLAPLKKIQENKYVNKSAHFKAFNVFFLWLYILALFRTPIRYVHKLLQLAR